MSTKSKTSVEEGTPTYLESGDPVRRRPDSLWSWSTAAPDKYHPVWVESLADDVTLDESLEPASDDGEHVVRFHPLRVR